MTSATTTDTQPDLGRMLSLAAWAASSVATRLDRLDTLADSANRAIAFGGDHPLSYSLAIQTARRDVEAGMSRVREYVVAIVAELARAGEDVERGELDLAPARIDADIARAKLGLLDRWPLGEERRGASPLESLEVWYSGLARMLRERAESLGACQIPAAPGVERS